MTVIRPLSIYIFLIKSFANIHYNIGGALNSMTPSTLELISESFTLATLPEKKQGYFPNKPSLPGQGSSSNRGVNPNPPSESI